VGIANLVEHDGAEKAQTADDQDVIRRRTASRAQMTKDTPRQHVVPSHAEEQTSGAESTGQRATESCEDEDQSHCIKQERAANTAANIHKGGFQIWERVPVRPD